MARLPFPDHVRELLRKPNPAVVSTLRSDGSPVSVATWYLLEDDDRVLLNMDHTRARVEHLRRDPRASLTVLDEAGWYTHVSLDRPRRRPRRRPRPRRHRPSGPSLHRRPLPQPRVPRINGWLVVDRWHGWGATRER